MRLLLEQEQNCWRDLYCAPENETRFSGTWSTGLVGNIAQVNCHHAKILPAWISRSMRRPETCVAVWQRTQRKFFEPLSRPHSPSAVQNCRARPPARRLLRSSFAEDKAERENSCARIHSRRKSRSSRRAAIPSSRPSIFRNAVDTNSNVLRYAIGQRGGNLAGANRASILERRVAREVAAWVFRRAARKGFISPLCSPHSFCAPNLFVKHSSFLKLTVFRVFTWTTIKQSTFFATIVLYEANRNIWRIGISSEDESGERTQ